MYLDIFIIIVVLLALFHGWNNGFLKEMVSLLGFLLGFIVACLCYSLFGKYLSVDGSTLNVVLSIVAFFILWIVVPILFGVVATIITSGLKHIPIVGSLNRLGGCVVSLGKYVLLLSMVLNAMSALRILNGERIASSRLYEPTISITGIAASLVIDEAVGPSTNIDSNNQDIASDTIWIDVKH